MSHIIKIISQLKNCLKLDDTLKFALKNLKRYMGFKPDVTIFSDGAESQNWNKELFGSLPKLAQEYSEGNFLKSFRFQKGVSGHGKGFLSFF